MSRENNGGPAFPSYETQAVHAYAMAKAVRIEDSAERDRVYIEARAECIQGMSLRDYFAAKAMQSFCADMSTGTMGEAAESAYLMADVMLAERAK